MGGPLCSGMTDALELHRPNGRVNGGKELLQEMVGNRKWKSLGLVSKLRKRAKESKARLETSSR